MPKGKYAQLTSWSFSTYQQYVKCPMSIMFEKIQRVRVPEPPNPYFEKGDRVHKAADQAISAPRAPRKLEPELTGVKKMLSDLRARKARTEQEWAFDRQWNPVDWRDWNRAWLRVKTDVCADTVEPPTVDIIDWKTGRQHAEHAQQRSLYALAGLRLVQIGALAGGDKAVELTAQHVYVESGMDPVVDHYQFKHLEPLKREWLSRTKQMLADTTYPAKPGNNCRWCKFRKANGGPCKEG